MQQTLVNIRTCKASFTISRRGARPVGTGCGSRQLLPVQRCRRVPVLAAYQQDPQPNSSSSSGRSSGSSGSGSSSSSGGLGPSSTALLAPTIFGSLEALLARQFSSSRPGERNDWQELEGCWVLRPPAGTAPEAVAHFLGGAFVGAAPQLSYRQFLEGLAARGVLVITTPFGTSFDQLRTADEVQYKFDRCCKALTAEVGELPVYGVGHSMGSLLHMLINARYAVKREGNVLMSYNNRPATDAIPFLSPILAPSARAVGPLLEQLATSPLRSGLETVSDALRGVSPSLVRQLMPIFDQLTPIYMDVAQGRQEFSPTPQETAQLLRNYYGVSRNLILKFKDETIDLLSVVLLLLLLLLPPGVSRNLILKFKDETIDLLSVVLLLLLLLLPPGVSRNLILKFKDDSIDDSIELAQLLQGSAAISSRLDLSLRTLDGDHIRPMAQALVDLPPEVARVANQAAATGGQVLGRLADMASQMGVAGASGPLADLSKGVSNMASMLNAEPNGQASSSAQELADEVAAWMGVGDVVVKGRRALPASAIGKPAAQAQ
uniref:Uncharacterized protein n=1 Tax=Tetradesmus obliquus TaxID=3088 RepID=A0A383W0Y9_TETOB|eukprot:jgi/Sobl393_1/4949/SZX70850.1